MAFDALRDRVHELKDLSGLVFLANWDQQTYLPPKGEDAQGHQLATLQGILHERLVDPALGELLERAGTGPLMVRVLSRERDRAVRVPPSLVRALASARQPEDVLSGRRFEAGTQRRFTLRLLEEMGFDFGAGRQDQSVHPFSGGTHPRDVRLTTRIDEGQLSAVFASLHEGGHGLYEQGFSESHHRTPLAAAPSTGLDESQARLWENLLGRSRPFWRRFFPVLQQHFPRSLSDVTADGFHGAINRVGPSLIRGQADEVTYNLHIAGCARRSIRRAPATTPRSSWAASAATDCAMTSSSDI